MKIIAALAILAILPVTLTGCGSDDRASDAQPGLYTITSDNVPGCRQSSQYEQVQTYGIQGDDDLAKQTLSRLISSGECVLFNSDERVYLMEAGMGMGKIRREGQTTEYWVSSSHIDRQ